MEADRRPVRVAALLDVRMRSTIISTSAIIPTTLQPPLTHSVTIYKISAKSDDLPLSLLMFQQIFLPLFKSGGGVTLYRLVLCLWRTTYIKFGEDKSQLSALLHALFRFEICCFISKSECLKAGYKTEVMLRLLNPFKFMGRVCKIFQSVLRVQLQGHQTSYIL